MQMNVAVIFAAAIPQVEAASRVTKTIPIVFSTHDNPMGAGHVVSLSRPGGNITGLSNLPTELTAKGLQALTEAFPTAMVIGALREPDHAIAPTAMKALEDAAAHVGLRVHMVSVRSEDDFDGARRLSTRLGFQRLLLRLHRSPGTTVFVWES
jgi:putative ABC transport system substrate-binding protein